MFFSVGGRYDPSLCPNVRIILPKYIFPMSWQLATTLYEAERTKQEWLEFVADSFSIDFYQSSLMNYQKIMKPKYYGKKMPAYAALGPDFCPLSFDSVKLFWLKNIELK